MRIERVMIVGGRASLVNGNLKRKLGEYGITVIKHHEEPHRAPPVLKACQGVIVIKDMISHAPIQKLIKETQARDLPIAFIPRKWAKAEPVLRSRGFLPPATNGKIRVPTQLDLNELVLSYLVEERRKGRVPQQAEVETVVQRAFGPKTLLPMAKFTDLSSRAAAEVPFPDARVIESNRQQTNSHIREFTLVLLEEHPEDILDQPQMVLRVFKQLDKHQKSLVTSADVETQVVNTVLWKQAQWGDTEKGRGARNKHIDVWLERQWESFKGGVVSWPTHSTLNKEGTAIFGIAPPKHLIKSTRARVLGSWALDLIGARKVDTDARIKWGPAYSKLVPTYEALLCLLEEEAIQGYTIRMFQKGVAIRARWMTSMVAVRTYLERRNTIEPETPEPRTPEPRTPEPRTPELQTLEPPVEKAAPSASDIAVEVGLLLENSIRTQVAEAVAQFEMKFTKGLLEVVQASVEVGAQVEGLVKQVDGVRTQMLVPAASPSMDIETQFNSLGEQLDELTTGQGNLLELVVAMSKGTGKALNDHNQLIMDQLTELRAAVTQGGGGGSKGVSLRDLAELAQEFNMAVTVEAGKVPKNKDLGRS